ncbi:MAG: CapA family protein [Firmicutes bacterium]|nr:CapA family protein [Bacillota bacterium]
MGLLVAGDVMLSRNVRHRIAGIAASLQALKSSFPGCALVANLESPVCTAPLRYQNGFRADPGECKEILRMFDVLSVANNHAMDCGVEGLEETVAFLKGLGIQVVGYRGSEGKQNGAVITIGDTKVGIVGYVERALLVEEPPSILATCSDLSLVQKEIGSIREQSDITVCILHAGSEMTRFPSKAERALPRRLVEMGVTVVIRSHAHVIQGCERLESSLVLYGLGDFIFDSSVRRRRTGALAHITVEDSRISVRHVLVRRDTDHNPLISGSYGDLPSVPDSWQKPRQIIDRLTYYCERTADLISTYGMRGVAYVIRRIARAMMSGFRLRSSGREGLTRFRI